MKMKQETENRKCIVCGEVKEKELLLRFTLALDNQVVPDFKKKLPGKGIYVSVSKTALQKAVEKNLFAKAVKKNAKVSAELVQTVENILRKKGLEKVGEKIRHGKAAFLLEAADAGADGHQKITALANGLEIFALYSVEELDKALDRVNTVHAALLKGDMAKLVHTDLVRLQRFLNS